MSATQDPLVGGKLREIGSSGLKEYGGYISEDPNPEFNGQRWRETLRRMAEGDPVVSSALLAISLLVRNAQRQVKPANGSRKAIKAAKLVREALDDLNVPFDQVLGEACSMNTFGWAYMEIVYKERRGPKPPKQTRRRADGSVAATVRPAPSRHNDGQIGWRKFALRPQDTLAKWEFDDDGGIQAMVQLARPSFKTVRIPIEKALLFRPETYKNNPEGRSLIKAAWRPWYIMRNIEQAEAIGVERDLGGLPVFEIPAAMLREDADDADKQVVGDLEDLGENIRNDAVSYAIIPQVWVNGNKQVEFKLMASDGKRAYDTGAIIARYSHRILLAILAQFLLLGSEKVGSFALSTTQSDLFAEAVNAICTAIAETFNRHAIPRLIAINGIAPELAPTLSFGKVKKIDPRMLAEYIQRLAQAGMRFFPSKSNEDYLYNEIGIPVPPDDDRPESDGQIGGAQGDGTVADLADPKRVAPGRDKAGQGEDDEADDAKKATALMPDGMVEYE